jgi:hypothetical protein
MTTAKRSQRFKELTMSDDALADLEIDIGRALIRPDAVREWNEFFSGSPSYASREQYWGFLLRSCWRSKGAPVLAGRVYNVMKEATHG